MTYLGLKVKPRKKGKTKLPSPCRHNHMICAINCRWDETCQEHIETKQHFLPYGEPNLYNDNILKDTDYIDYFGINFPYDCVLEPFPLDTNLLNNVVLWKEVMRQTKKIRSVDPHKLKWETTTRKKHVRETRNSGLWAYRYLGSLGV